ncbi:MAG: hypothetical protein WA672_01280 [Candidatus Angelobacter sp.]
MKNTIQDFPIVLLSFFAKRLPLEEKLWGEAMLGELAAISGFRKRLAWALSGGWGLGRIRMRSVLGMRRQENVRPLAVTLIALYHGIFSCAILAMLVWQIPVITEPWKAAIFPLLFAFFVALVPGVIAIGLWLLDDAARLMAMLFSLLHALANYAYLSTLRPGSKLMPSSRIVLDLLMITVLLLPSIRRSFRPERMELGLRS